MHRYLGQILAMVGCVAVEGVIYYGLFGLGVEPDLVLWAEMIWMCAAILIVLSVGERFDRR